MDMRTEKVVWQKSYDKGCDRMALSPDGKTIYQPSFEKDDWYILDALTGKMTGRVSPKSKSHNTLFGLDGNFCYLAGLGSPQLSVVDTQSQKIVRQIGPFSDSIRPFTLNGKQTLVFVNINKCLGFEIGDLQTGKKLHRVEVAGYEMGPVKRHGCPSHGIGMTPDEKEIWVCDAHNKRVHIFDATAMPPKQIANVVCRDEPGWIMFSNDGTLAYPSSGDVIDVKTRSVVAQLTDEEQRAVGSEKIVEIDWVNDAPVRVGNQFGVGQVR
jgi:DNA-binding beta-propeller fold protein YncE